MPPVWRQGWDEPHVLQAPVFRLPQLEDAKPLAGCHDPHPYGNVETPVQMGSDFLGELGGWRRENIDVLCHAGLFDVSVYRMGPKQNGILTAAEKLQQCVLNRRQRQRLAHRELRE